MNTSQSPVAVISSAILVTVILGVGFAEAYDLIEPMVEKSWVGAAMFHSFLTIGFFIWSRKKFNKVPLLESKGPILYYYPSLVILGLAAIAAFSTRMTYGIVHTRGISEQYFFWILWVPIVEEIVFRGMIGEKFRASFGVLWGTWFSALVFALVHAKPTIANLAALNVGVPIGPFLLGLAAEFLLIKSRSLWPAIALHAACNATPVIFKLIDHRWLKWLEVLYI
jgi:membrane protease YdiL (CAAX protease family)